MSDMMRTENDRPVQVHVTTYLQWVLGMCAVMITSLFAWGTKEIVELGRQFEVMDSRVSVIERTRFTAADWIKASEDHITTREYDAAMTAIQTSLTRIENKLDRGGR